MHDHQALIVTAFLILVFGLVSKLSEKSPITAPMFFLAAGILFSFIGLFDVHVEMGLIKTLAELTLIIILFVDASLIKFDKLGQALSGIPTRLLAIGLPLTMILGSVIGSLLFPHWSIWLIVLIALILSPTDAALGQAVIKSEKVPKNIRDSVSIESGLNDGIALPPILVCIAALSAPDGMLPEGGNWFNYLFLQLTLGPLIGALIGWGGGKAIEFASKRDWMAPTFQQLSSVSLAIVAFAFAELFHGNGFISAFFAGLILAVQTKDIRHRIQEFGEAEGQLFSLSIFFLLGLVAVPTFFPYWNMQTFIYALLSLTLIRMLPVFLSLQGTQLSTSKKLFVGWFGPRGIASVLYLLIVIAELGSTGYEEALSVVVLTVILSTFLHGISATFLTNKISR
ncbi:cation:proton antiporter [Thalassotalea aquiviva]|uniref:cation:proton antiporter n=1 Tax=Thalassotalea aquiviva TaxID=3242415 RepID=UPI00352B14C7